MSKEVISYTGKLPCYDICSLKNINGIRPCGDGFNKEEGLKDDMSPEDYPCRDNIIDALALFVNLAIYKRRRFTYQSRQEDELTVFADPGNIITPYGSRVFAEIKNGRSTIYF